MRNLLLSTLCLSLFISCRKTNNIPTDDRKVTIAAGTYKTSDSVYDDPPIMYVSNSVITDQQAIKDFLVRYDAEDSINFNSSEVNSNPVIFEFKDGFSFTQEASDNTVSFSDAPITITARNTTEYAIIKGIRVKGTENINDSSTAIELQSISDSIPFSPVFDDSDGDSASFAGNIPDTADNYFWYLYLLTRISKILFKTLCCNGIILKNHIFYLNLI